MDAVQLLETDLKNEVAKARAIIDAADAEGREFSPTEREASQKSIDRQTELRQRIEGEREKEKFRHALGEFETLGLSSVDRNPVRSEAQAETRAKAGLMTLGDYLVNSPDWEAIQARAKAQNGVPRRFETSKIEVPPEVVNRSLRMKAAGDPVLESDNAAVFAGGPGPLTTFLGLETPGFVQFPPTVEDLLTTVPVTTGNNVTYPIVKTRTQASATPQTEGGAKAGTEYEFDMVTKVLETIAAYVKLSTQFIEDAPGLVAYINTDLPLQVRQNVETTIVAALYAATFGTGGGDSVDGTGVSSTNNGFDALLEAITVIQENGGNPNAVIITPLDWAFLLASKDNENRYLGGGPFTATSNPWNLRFVVTPSADPGMPLVGDFNRGAKLYSRGGYQVDSTNSDQDDFIKNKFTVRAERRVITGVTYPEFFVGAQIGST